MIFRLILLFTLVPLIELSLLIELGRHIGLGSTIAIVIVTGVIGAYLAKYEGFKVIAGIRQELGAGKIPAEGLIDGIIILAGGLLLLTPGLLTDSIGFLALIPVSRNYLKQYLKRKFKQKLDSKEIHPFYTIDDDSVS
ncbi:MAG: FxsA family protein [Gammaproteobacteria bacterium]|nr:FxsA family protein [Gammaproteobacteria bacterium]